MIASDAPEEDVDDFTNGRCHVFALALHRMTNWTIMLAVDNGCPYWDDPTDSDNFIPTVAHAYCVDGEGNAWDVAGVRPLDDVEKELRSWIEIEEFDTVDLGGVDDLWIYSGCWGEDADGEPIDRPLRGFTEQEVSDVEFNVREALGNLLQLRTVKP